MGDDNRANDNDQGEYWLMNEVEAWWRWWWITVTDESEEWCWWIISTNDNYDMNGFKKLYIETIKVMGAFDLAPARDQTEIPEFGLARLKRTRLLSFCFVTNGHIQISLIHREVLLDAKNSVSLAMVPVYHQYYGYVCSFHAWRYVCS